MDNWFINLDYLEVGRLLVLPLGAPCPLLPRVSIHSQPEVELRSIIETPLLVVIAFNYPSAIPTVLVLVPTILIVGLAVVLHGRKTGWSDLVCHRCGPGQLRYEWAPPQVTQLCSTAFTGAGAGTGDVCLSRSRALTISFNSATSRYSRSRKLANISVPLDHFPVNSLTSKVFSFMIKKGKHFSGKVTPLFDTMLVQPTQDEGASSERLSDEQPSPSPAPTSEVPNESLPDSSSAQPSEVPFEQQPDPSPRPSPRPSPKPSPTPIVPDSIPEPTGENLGDHSSNDTSLSGNEDDMTLQNVYDLCISLCQQVSDQAKEIKLLKAKITKLKKQAKPVIKHHKEYLKSVSLQQRFPRKSFSKKHRVHKESVSKQGRKKAKGESSVQRNSLFDVLTKDKIDHMETKNAQSEGRTREMVDEVKEFDEDRLSTEDGVSTDKEGVSTDFEKVSTDRPIVSTNGSKVSTDEQVEGTEEHFEGTKEQREYKKEKAREDDDIPQAVKKFKQLESDEEMARKIQEEWEAEERIKEEENTQAKRKAGTRKKMKSRKRRFKQDTSQDDPSDIEKENDELRLCLTIAPDEDKEVDYEILDKKYPIIDWKTENLGTKPQIPEGFDKVLWGDLIVMFNPDEQDEFWNSQHEWKVVSWKLHSSSGVHTLMTDEGLVVHMLIEKKYPLKRKY
ncbi:hypothetical protein Tco_0005340 [Tanacetum coccineum]